MRWMEKEDLEPSVRPTQARQQKKIDLSTSCYTVNVLGELPLTP